MKKSILTFVLFLSTTILYGQNNPKTILWKVTKEGNQKESFLFGTFHEVSPSFFLSLPDVVDLLEQSDVLFVEERTAVWQDSTVIEQPSWNARKWNEILNKQQEKIFADFVKKAEDSSYYKANPLILSFTTSRLYIMNFCEQEAEFDELMDTYIEKIAVEKNKQVFSLDSSHRMILKNTYENFNSLQDSLYASYSIQAMENMLNDDLSGCEMISTYKNFDIDYALDNDITEQSHPLLVERNRKWVQTLDKAFLSNNCFVAIGFSHLLYQQGLIQRLRQLGYQVTPVPIKG
ncbi:TraB/GumN family protein [Echinicola sp. CAU 1574]|uniref:TraB/GumN family protein n=1 Tax=Echinicola arenosa TaxID=2774144 RepID=A0ABR9AHH8_9BACT|nr:TraB/GumN family protein [Echinicola arenosa]MBD8488261.1 TraB/GumN family protein [Echinicola arenosa]